MDDYVRQLEQQNEELKELLAMKEEDSVIDNFFSPHWTETTGFRGVEYRYCIRKVGERSWNFITNSKSTNFEDEELATIKQSYGTTPDKIWCATSRYHNFMEFFSSVETAKSEIQTMWRKSILELVNKQ